MGQESVARTGQILFSLIELKFSSDAAFERAFMIPEKTVNNWRRGRSSSFMRMLPELSEKFKMNVGEIMDMPVKGDSSELSDGELALIQLYRKTRTMPEKMRSSLYTTLETTINMYIQAHHEMKRNERRLKQKAKD